MRCNGARVIRYGRCPRMHAAVSLSVTFFSSGSYSFSSVSFSHFISPPLVFLCFSLRLSPTAFFFSPLAVTHTKTEVIISGRLGVKVLTRRTTICIQAKQANEDIVLGLHTAVSHLHQRNTYMRILLTDCSSAFYSFVPSKLVFKL